MGRTLCVACLSTTCGENAAKEDNTNRSINTGVSPVDEGRHSPSLDLMPRVWGKQYCYPLEGPFDGMRKPGVRSLS